MRRDPAALHVSNASGRTVFAANHFPRTAHLNTKKRGDAVLEYSCEWCGRRKQHQERWFLALAAEKKGRAGQRREVAVVPMWTAEAARHPFAVHFCSQEHLRSYVAAVLGRGAPPGSRSGGPLSETSCATATATAKPKSRRKKKRSLRDQPKTARDWTQDDIMRAHALGIHLDPHQQ
jgi:hypothetical protein